MRRGSTLDNDLFTGKEGEITIDTTVKTIRVHDEVTPGGFALALADLSNVNEDTLKDLIQELINSTGPGGEGEPVVIGGIKTGFVSPGEEFMLADGSFLDKVEYADLYELFGDRYGMDGAVFLAAPSIATPAGGPNVNTVGAAINGNTVVVANTQGNYTVTTDGGTTWQVVNDGSSVSVNKIVYGAGKFVAVGSSKIATSSDGLTWSLKTDITSNFTQLFFLNNRFFAFAPASGASYTSTDAVTWTQMTIPVFTSAVPLTGIYNTTLGLYVIGGASAALMTSPDGLNWSSRVSNMTNNINGIAFNGSIMVAAGGNTTATANIATSPDGVTWTARANTIANYRSAIVWSPVLNLFVTTGYAGINATSPDGVTWTALNSTQSGLGAQNGVAAIATPAGVITSSNVSWSNTTDGATFTQRSVTTFRGGNTLLRNTDTGDIWFVGPGSSSLTGISKSIDNGNSAYWLFQASGFSSISYKGAVTDGNNLIFSTGGAQTSSNPDLSGGVAMRCSLTSSSNVHVVTGVASTRGFIYKNGLFVHYGNNGGIATSPDGVAWTTRWDIPASVNINAIDFQNGIWIAIGSNGSIYRSSNGTSWTSVSNPATGVNLTALTYDSNTNTWYASGANTSLLLKSSDGITWTTINLPNTLTVVKILTTSRFIGVVHQASSNAFVSFFVLPISGTGNWTLAPLSTRSIPAASNDLFVAVGYTASSNSSTAGMVSYLPVAYSSGDGITWTPTICRPALNPVSSSTVAVSAATIFTAVTYTGKGFVAFGCYNTNVNTLAVDTNSGTFQFTSNDGQNWTQSYGNAYGQFDSYISIHDGYITGASDRTTSSMAVAYMRMPDPTKFKIPFMPPADGHQPNNYIKVREAE
jgi:microcystin-dependent protein